MDVEDQRDDARKHQHLRREDREPRQPGPARLVPIGLRRDDQRDDEGRAEEADHALVATVLKQQSRSARPSCRPSSRIGAVGHRAVPYGGHADGLPFLGHLVEDPVGADAQGPETA